MTAIDAYAVVEPPVGWRPDQWPADRPAGFAQAVGQGAGQGAPGGGAGGALSHVTGIARYGCFTPDTPVLMADGTRRLIHSVCG